MSRSAGNKGYIALLVVALSAMTAFAAPTQQTQDVTTVITIGSSRIVGDDMSSGREQAIADGLAAAAYQVLAGFLPEEVFATSFQAINERIFNHTDQFVNDYKVLSESRHGKSYRLLLQAGISVQNIKDALKTAGIWVDHQQLPRVLVCVAEKMIDEIDYRYWWGPQPVGTPSIATAVLSRELASNRFVVLKPTAGSDGGQYPWHLNPDDAVALGRLYEADVVVTGTAAAEQAPNTMGGEMQSFRGTVSLKAYRVSDGMEIAQSHRSVLSAASDSMTGGQEAVQNAAAQAAADLAHLIQQAWQNEGAGSFQIEIQVEGTGGNIASFVKFRGALSTMSGVDSIQLSEMTTNEAVLKVGYQGNAHSLADAILIYNFDTFGVNILEVGPNSIRLKLTPP